VGATVGRFVGVRVGVAGRFVGVRVGVAYALRTRLRNLNLKSRVSIFDSFRDIGAYIFNFFKIVGVKVGVAN